MADEAVDAEDEDFSHGKGTSPQAATRCQKSLKPRILPGLAPTGPN
jgi:hypothetical protein